MYWSLNVISTESSVTVAGSMIRITTSEKVGKLNADAMLASMLITSKSAFNEINEIVQLEIVHLESVRHTPGPFLVLLETGNL